MAKGFSKAVVYGNITRDPELRSTPSGAQVCGFTIAVGRRYKDANGEWRDQASFFDCSAWGRVGETIAQYMHKGSAILVSGRLEQRTWTDQDGKKRSKIEVVVEDFSFVGGKGGSSEAAYEGDEKKTDSKKSSTVADANEEVPTDIDESKEIDLSEIPF